AAVPQEERKGDICRAEVEIARNPGALNLDATRIDLLAGLAIDYEPADQIGANVARRVPFFGLCRIVTSAEIAAIRDGPVERVLHHPFVRLGQGRGRELQ